MDDESSKSLAVPPHRRDGEPWDQVASYCAAIGRLVEVRARGPSAKNVVWEVLILDVLDRLWSKMSDEEKHDVMERIRAAYGNRWE